MGKWVIWLTEFQKGVRVFDGLNLGQVVNAPSSTIRVLQLLLEALSDLLQKEEAQLLRVASLSYGEVYDAVLHLIATKVIGGISSLLEAMVIVIYCALDVMRGPGGTSQLFHELLGTVFHFLNYRGLPDMLIPWVSVMES